MVAHVFQESPLSRRAIHLLGFSCLHHRAWTLLDCCPRGHPAKSAFCPLKEFLVDLNRRSANHMYRLAHPPLVYTLACDGH